MQKTLVTIIIILLPTTILSSSRTSDLQPAGCMMCHQPSSSIADAPNNKQP